MVQLTTNLTTRESARRQRFEPTGNVTATNVQTAIQQVDTEAAGPTTTRGDLIARGATTNARLPLGTSGYALLSNGTDPAWAGFLQAGTGAVTRTWNSKAADVFSVTDFGAIGTADDSAVFTLAVNAAANSAGGGGTVMIPAGIFHVQGLILPNGVTLQGAGKNATYLQSWYVDNFVVSIAGGNAGIADLSIYGKGVNGDTGAFGAVNPALYVTGVANNIRRVTLLGGAFPLYITGSDNLFEDISTNNGYSSAGCVSVGGANWFIRCKFDHSTVAVAATDVAPFTTAWASTTAYTVGKVRVVGSYAIICTVSGTSGGSAPTLKNYGLNIVDGSVTWQLLAPASFSAVWVATGSGENHFTQCDLSGYYSSSLRVDSTPGTSGPSVVVMTDSVFSAQVLITNGALVILHGNELGANIVVDTAYTGKLIIEGNSSLGGTIGVTIGANVSNFIISDNIWTAGAITVAAGTSDHYRIKNNTNTTVTDGGTGTDKVVQTSSLLSFGSNATIQSPVITLQAPSGTSDIRFGVANTSGATLTVAGTTGGAQVWKTSTTTTGTMTWPSGTVDFSATGGASQVVKQTSLGGMFTVGQLAFSDISGALTNAQLTIAAGTLASLGTALSITATQPASPSGLQAAIPITITGAGTAAQTNEAVLITYAAGYTGASSTFAYVANNLNAGTGNTVVPAAGSNTAVGNTGASGAAVVTTTGANMGVRGSAALGSVNVAVHGIAQIATNSATNIGVLGSGINTGTSPVSIGGFFSLNQTTVPAVSSALIADNGSQALPVALFRVNNVTKVQVDASGNLLGIGATNGIGYGTGAGGTVTQGAGSGKATAVSLSTVSGAITMNNAALAAATIVSFVLTNTAIAATDVLVLNHISGGTVGSYTLNAQCAAGSATINVRNNTGGSLSEAIVIQFALIKAVNS